ncbi:MAG: class I SAM-dependent methyltransferase [Actinomycetota bacterium]
MATIGHSTFPVVSDLLVDMIGGYVGTRTIAAGLRHGILAAMTSRAEGTTMERVAEVTGLDPVYLGNWLQLAVASSVVVRDGNRYAADERVADALLNTDLPNLLSGVFGVISQPEVFDEFSNRLPMGGRASPDEASPSWLYAATRTDGSFYTQMIPVGLDQIPDLTASLGGVPRMLDAACGSGYGVVRLAETYPNANVVGLCTDDHAIGSASARVHEAGLSSRIQLLHESIEEADVDPGFDVVIYQGSMHVQPDLESTCKMAVRLLRDRGFMVVSGFPFPDTDDALRTPLGRLMAAMQIARTMMGGSLTAVASSVGLLERNGYVDVGTVDLTPLHSLTFGRVRKA